VITLINLLLSLIALESQKRIQSVSKQIRDTNLNIYL